MASQKRLKSVIQSIAHHSVSGLSFIHPHLGKACKEKGLPFIRIDLLAENPCPEIFRKYEPLQLSLFELKNKFNEILNLEGFNSSDLKSVFLTFQISSWDNYSAICDARLVSSKNRRYEYKVDYMGTTEQLH